MDKINEDGYRITDTHVFFYKKWLSNFGKCQFKWEYQNESGTFFCTEQAFMWAKALFFGDYEVADKILAEKESPSKCKNLGREVKNYDDEKWDKVRYNIMYQVNLAKYSQNKDLCKKLFNPDFWNKTFVEASPIDCIWGVGMELENDAIVNPDNWRGRNLLGKAITEARDAISLQGMLKVKDLIEHLKKYDPEGFILYGEMNAFEGGFWQHVAGDMVGQFAHSVKEDKADIEERYKNDVSEMKRILDRDYIYAKDNDVIVRF